MDDFVTNAAKKPIKVPQMDDFVPISAKKQARKIRRKKRPAKAKAEEQITEEEKIQKILDSLKGKIQWDNEELRQQYDAFMSVCPNGEMAKEMFCELSAQYLGPDAEFLTEALFRIFDEDNSGSMCFTEYCLALNATK